MVTYGIGGYDPTKPNDNIVEIIDIPDEGEVIEDPETGKFVAPVIEDPAIE